MIEVRTVAEVEDRSQVDAFLGRHFRPAKATFLRDHGTWWHRGDDNRWVLLEDGEVLGYCAVIPTRIAVDGEPVEASWWVDLVIDPAARGRKLQRHFDDLIRSRPLTLGFPNALAAEIHRKHGWGVREDLQVRLLPLDPVRMPALASRPPIARALLIPLLRLLGRQRNLRAGSASASQLGEAHLTPLAELAAARARPSCLKVQLDQSTLRWRYLESPSAVEHFVVLADDVGVVLRLTRDRGSVVARILEVLAAPGGNRQPALAAATHLARQRLAAQVTGLASDPKLESDLGATGLRLRSRARFCWYSKDSMLMRRFAKGPHDWSLGNADNDEP